MYWYARQRVGDRTVDRYIGRDTPELRERPKALESTESDRKALDARCAGWVAQLRAGRLPALDRESGKVLGALARVRVFRPGGPLVGMVIVFCLSRRMTRPYGFWDFAEITNCLALSRLGPGTPRRHAPPS